MVDKLKVRLLELIKSALDLFNSENTLVNQNISLFNNKAILITHILNKSEIYDLNLKFHKLKYKYKDIFFFGWVKEFFKTLLTNHEKEKINLDFFFNELKER